ncbi:1-acyl-sn-glycerol-3-phosphate acyltransferase [Shigella sonnei]
MDPLFGQLYWLTGNFLIDRNNRTKAHGTCGSSESLQKTPYFHLDVPEGTRSRGRGLLPFKTGAFTRQCGGRPITRVRLYNFE